MSAPVDFLRNHVPVPVLNEILARTVDATANPVGVTKYREKPAAAQSEATIAGPVPQNRASMMRTSRRIWAAVAPLTVGPSSSNTAMASATDATAKKYRWNRAIFWFVGALMA